MIKVWNLQLPERKKKILNAKTVPEKKLPKIQKAHRKLKLLVSFQEVSILVHVDVHHTMQHIVLHEWVHSWCQLVFVQVYLKLKPYLDVHVHTTDVWCRSVHTDSLQTRHSIWDKGQPLIGLQFSISSNVYAHMKKKRLTIIFRQPVFLYTFISWQESTTYNT